MASYADAYIVQDYGAMLRSSPRADGYVEALRRSITPGGVLIPQRNTIWVTPVESDELYKPFMPQGADYGLSIRRSGRSPSTVSHERASRRRRWLRPRRCG